MTNLERLDEFNYLANETTSNGRNNGTRGEII